MRAPTDFLTVLTHNHSRLAKLWLPDGTISNYDETKHYSATETPVSSIVELSAALSALESKPHSAVIRGKFKGLAAAAVIDAAEHKVGLTRKIKALYDDAPHHWVLIEVDKFTSSCNPVLEPVKAIAEYVDAHLPTCFHDVSHHWQLSSSAGHPSKAGTLRVHLWYWLTTPATSDQLKAWAKSPVGVAADLDSSVFNTVQFHYCAAPLMSAGMTDPVPVRSGFHDGLFSETVNLDLPAAINNIAYSPAVGNALAATSADGNDLLCLHSTLGWSIEQAREIMFGVDANVDRATWVSDLAALHHEFRGDVTALDLAVEWSATADNFTDAHDVQARWASFGKHIGNPITGKWLIKRRAECQAGLKYTAKAEWSVQLSNAADEFTIRETICPKIAKDTRLDELGKEALAQLLFEAFKRLGTRYPIAECRKLIAEKRTAAAMSPASMPPWAKPWLYVTNDDKFFQADSEVWLTKQGFNARFNRELPRDEDTFVLDAAAVALNDLCIPVVTKSMYLPCAAPVFVHEGVECVNTYRPSSVPTPVSVLSAADLQTVALVTRHIDLLAGGRSDVVNTMLDWLAHNVQKPGTKIRWAPLLKGVEGDGKTVMGALLASVMGRVNVRNVSPKVLATDFTGWAEGVAVVALEEIKLTGHNRYDILNSLKPFITNDSIEVHSKGKDTRESVNTVNYIAFTNYADALPLGNTDRRWWIVFTPFAAKSEMEQQVVSRGYAPDLGAYFDDLHDAIYQHPAVFRRWLLDYQISAAFRPNGSAPMTDEKNIMVAQGSSDEEDAVRDVLANCEVCTLPGEERLATRGVTPHMFASRCMGDALLLSDAGLTLATSSRNALFNKAGFVKLAKKVKWHGEAHVIWVKGNMSLEPADVRSILDATLKTASEPVGYESF